MSEENTAVEVPNTNNNFFYMDDKELLKSCGDASMIEWCVWRGSIIMLVGFIFTMVATIK